jgi:hypothetical protein
MPFVSNWFAALPLCQRLIFRPMLALCAEAFSERVRGIVARQSTICIALSRRVIAFEYGLGAVQGKDKGKAKAVEAASEGGIWMKKLGEWETAENEAGERTSSSSSSLLVCIADAVQD